MSGQPADRESAAHLRFHEFASTTVHHLREPVRMVQVYAEVLKNPAESPAEQHQAIEFLTKAASQMQRLLDGLAEFSSAEAMVPRISEFGADLPLRQAMINLAPEIESHHVTCEVAELPIISGDYDGVQLIFQHLLHNAIRYCDDKSPEIKITGKALDAECLLEIRDNGPGIGPEFRERIFLPYKRLHGKTIPGNGLGLATCRAIVEKHGGRIWVQPEPGPGSAFCFTLPRS